MTVRELIEKLEQLDDNQIVYVEGDDGFGQKIVSVDSFDNTVWIQSEQI